MLDKFNFYDVLGYLIPGSIATLALYWFGVAGLRLSGLPALGGDLGSSLVFVGAAYVAGHLVQSIGHWWEGRSSDRSGGRLSERLLLPASALNAVERKHQFSADLQNRIIDSAQKLFVLPDAPSNPREAAVWRRELFEQCYALLVQEDSVQHTEVFLAINGLSRGLVVASLIALAASGLLAVRQGLLWIIPALGIHVPSAGAWKPDYQTLVLALVAVIGSILAWRLALEIFTVYRAYFAKSIYFNFIAWCGKQQFKSK